MSDVADDMLFSSSLSYPLAKLDGSGGCSSALLKVDDEVGDGGGAGGGDCCC